MKTKLSAKETVVLSSMLFGLFFGAGNLIFPASMGQQAGSAMWPAIIGFCLTGVGLPLLGIAAMGISESDSLFAMSSRAGKGFGYFFTCALYLCIGPLFAIPRTATVSFSVGVSPLVPETHQSLSLFIFTFLFFAAVLFFSLRPSGILTWVGKILNPLFLAFLAVLLVTALVAPMGDVSTLAPTGKYADAGFFTGFLEGYNTMDALASLAFGIILINTIRGLGVTQPRHIFADTLKSGFFSILLMAGIYCALTMAGAQSRTVYGILENGGSVLHAIATHYFGAFGGLLLGATITFACLKTSIGLVTSCGEAFVQLFPRLCSYKVYAIVFSVFSFAIANVGLNRIINYSLPALLFLYPLTISLILLCLFGRLFRYRRCVFSCTLLGAGLAAVLDFANALPQALRTAPLFAQIQLVSQKLPLANIGMGWLTPAAVGLAIGLGYAVCTRRQDTAQG